MADIFVSYDHTDREKIEKLAAALEQEGYSVWWDRQIVGGAEFSKEIEKELNAAKAVIVAWSAASVKSTWVKDEAITARDQGKLIPISIGGAAAPMGFKQYFAIDFASWNGDGTAPAFVDLSRAVKAHLTGEAPEAIAAVTKQSWADRLKKAAPLAAIGVLGLIIGVIVMTSRSIDGKTTNSDGLVAPTTDAASIAVLPFTDLSPEGDQEYFSDGIAEEILNVLFRVEGLNVTSRTSSFQFRDRELGVPKIAEELQVRHLVEGSVRKAGTTIRITAQLIDAQSDRHLWSETYDRPLTAENIFEIQDEIATSIVKALSDALGMAPAADIRIAAITDNLSAYELYLKARTLILGRTDLRVADAYLVRALEQDPQFARAWEMRAALYHMVDEHEPGFVTPEAAIDHSVDFANRALAIDPESATALAVLASVRMDTNVDGRGPENMAQIAADYKRALSIDPSNTEALNWLGTLYTAVGELKLALDTYDRCIEIEPNYTPCTGNKAYVLAQLGRDDEAFALANASLDAGIWNIFMFEPALLARANEERLFKISANQPEVLYGWRKHDELYRAFKNPDEDHQALIDDIREFIGAKPGGSMQNIADFLIPIGAFDIPPIYNTMWSEAYQRYWQSEGFKKNIRKAGIWDYWNEVGFPPQCHPVGADDFKCE